MEHRRKMTELSFIVCMLALVFPVAENISADEVHPDEIEEYELNVTFPPDMPSHRVLSVVGGLAVKRVVETLNLKLDPRGVDPEDFVLRVSVRRREPKPEGVEYTFVSAVNVRRLLLFASTGEKNYSFSLNNCHHISPLIIRAVSEYAVSANIHCQIWQMRESTGINSLRVRVSGVLGKDTSLNFERRYHFFSVFPYERIYGDLVSYVSTLKLRKVFKTVTKSVEGDRAGIMGFLSSLSGKAYFFSVVPFEVRRSKRTYRAKVYLTYPVIVSDSSVLDLIRAEAEKRGMILD